MNMFIDSSDKYGIQIIKYKSLIQYKIKTAILGLFVTTITSYHNIT